MIEGYILGGTLIIGCVLYITGVVFFANLIFRDKEKKEKRRKSKDEISKIDK